MSRLPMQNRALFPKKYALPALYLAVPFYICALMLNELDSYFYDLRPNTLSDISDALSWFFAPSLLLTLVIGGNPHDLNSLLLYAFSFAQTYLAALVIVILAGAIRRAARGRAAKPAG